MTDRTMIKACEIFGVPPHMLARATAEEQAAIKAALVMVGQALFDAMVHELRDVMMGRVNE